MTESVSFRNTMTPPPGGKFFFTHDGEHIEARTWVEMKPKMEDLMRRHGLTGFADVLVAEFMCPHMPSWYCTGSVSRSVTSVKDAKANAKPYYNMNLVTFDKLSDRMRRCHDCPMHERDVCLTCTGILSWILASFGGRRIRVHEDNLSGVCRCAKTFEAVIASVEHGGDPWPGAPDTCWRRTEK